MEILIILLLTVLNGVFAMSETAIISARSARLQQRVDEGSRGAKAALALKENPNRFLPTVQIGITLIGIIAGAFGGATVGEALGGTIAAAVPALDPYAAAIGFTLIVLLTTYLSLVVGELVPKRLALQYPERVAEIVAPPMNFLAQVTHVVVVFLGFSTNVVLRLIGIRPSEDPPVTQEEVQALVRQGTEAGIFDEMEESMVRGVFRLDTLPISASMTPRLAIDWLDVEDDMQTNWEKVIESEHSRFPVCEGDLDRVIGIVNSKDLLKRQIANETIDLRALVEPPLFIPERLPAAQALERMKATTSKMALVIGEYGDVEGVVTVRDILEEVVGDVEDPYAVQREDGSWLLDGMTPIDELRNTLDIDDALPGEDEGLFVTLGGFVMAQLKRIPQASDYFDWSGMRFEVMDMDGKRIDKVLVMRKEAQDTEDTDSDA